MEEREYQILLSKKYADRVGVNKLVQSAVNPQKAIREAFEKIGYKIRISRTYSYSPDPEGDIVVRFTGETGYDYFYKVRIMIQLF